MRRFRPQQKVLRTVSIPSDLQDSLRRVHELINEANTNPDISLDFDDAIQVGSVCGGRSGKKPKPFVLTYYPDGDTQRGRWFLALDRTEIEDIGDGRITGVEMSCCTSAECRCKFSGANARCFYCDYSDDPDFGTFEFPEAADKLNKRGVNGLTGVSTKEDVMSLLGKPDKVGGDIIHERLGYILPWFNYRRSDCQLNITFKEDKTIRMITILEKDFQPGK